MANGHLCAPSMEPMMESVAVDDLEVDGKVDLSATLHALSSSSFKGSENIGNEPALYEKFLLDDLDNYWDEINDRLTVSRMVSDSVIKGMVHAVVEESAERIASKEAEIAVLNEKLQLYDSRVATGIEFINLPSEHGCFSSTGGSENLDSLKVALEQQLHMLKEDIKNVTISSSHGRVNATTDSILCNGLLKERTNEQLVEIDARVDTIGVVVSAVFEELEGMFTSFKASVFENKWECNFQREINSVIVQSCVTGLHAEFEKKLYDQRNLIHMLRMNWQQKASELSTLREEFDSMSRSFLSSESSPLISYNSNECCEERSSAKQNDQFPGTISGNSQFSSTIHTEENGSPAMKKSKDIAQSRLEVADTSHLKHLNNEELATYYKTELLKLRRQHESALQEKTEEIFCLKRKFLNEKGSPFRKDKEFELLKKKIPEVILKLDDILLEKETLPIIETNYDDICNLKDKINALLSDNQRLQGLLTEKEKEVRNLSSQFSDAESQMSLHSSAETKYLTQIKALGESLEDMKTETDTSFELLNIVYKEVIDEYMFGREEIEVEIKLLQDIYTTAIRGVIGDAMTSAHSIISKYFTEISSLEALISEKQNLLFIETEENRKLKEAVLSLSTSMKEKENFASEADSMLMQQKQEFDLLNAELSILREQVSKQQILISKNKMESNLLQRRLEESRQQINQNESEISRLKKELVMASDALKEAEKQKTLLHSINEDKEKKYLSSIMKENQEAKQLHCIIVSLKDLSEAFVAFESKLTKKMEIYETRLKNLSHEFSSLFQWAHQLTRKEAWYKKILDMRYSNLQKAEAEVDLLGDEVDALLGLLGKIYIALDHYSPVLQLYPGVMEILKLVKRELEGETTHVA